MMLDIHDLTIFVKGENSPIVDHVHLQVGRGEVVALVGGSGSGKTTVGLSVLRLLSPGLKVSSGKILWNGKDLLSLSEGDMRKTRGAEIAMVFQEPLNAFDPLFLIYDQVDEVLRAHTQLNRRQRRDKVFSLLTDAGMADAARVMQSYPHQLSGGLRQRAMIAQALAGSPSLIIADEPTSSIDVTLQAKVIELFRRLRDELKISFLFITHDFGIVRHLADRVYVMHKGKIAEFGTVSQVLDHPQEEYTKGLIKATLV